MSTGRFLKQIVPRNFQFFESKRLLSYKSNFEGYKNNLKCCFKICKRSNLGVTSHIGMKMGGLRSNHIRLKCPVPKLDISTG